MVIDAHSHIGMDAYRGAMTIQEYMEFAKRSSISEGLLMLVPSPVALHGDSTESVCAWACKDGMVIRFGNRNPFLAHNYDLAEQIAQASSNDLKLHFVAYIDPVLDDLEQLDQMFADLSPVAVKLNGIGCGCGYMDMTREHIQLLQKYNLPLIIHTAYEHICSNPRMYPIRRGNSAYDWARLLEANRLRGVLNHGATLDRNAFRIVNESENLKIAVGPDKVSCTNNNRLHMLCENDPLQYLGILKQHVAADKLLYDADYHWNTPKGEPEDHSSVDRIRQVFGEEQDAVLYHNAAKFFGLKKGATT